MLEYGNLSYIYYAINFDQGYVFMFRPTGNTIDAIVSINGTYDYINDTNKIILENNDITIHTRYRTLELFGALQGRIRCCNIHEYVGDFTSRDRTILSITNGVSLNCLCRDGT